MDKKKLNDNELENVNGGQAIILLRDEAPEDAAPCGAEQKEVYIGMNKSELIDNNH